MKTLNKQKHLLIGMSIIMLLLIFTFSVSAETSVKNVEEHLMCMCKDNCGKMLSNCNCKFSDEMRHEIRTKLKDGLTKGEIIGFYIDKYGEKVLSAPTKRGFNLIAWLAPPIVLIAGFFLLRWVIVNWVRKGDEHKHTLDEAKDQPKKDIDPEYLDRLKKELDDFDS